MKTQRLRSAIALGSLTAAVALVTGLTNAQAQSAPGAGSFPQSFLIPGTNTSLSIYGTVKFNSKTQVGSQKTGDTSASGSMPFQISSLALGGPGAAGGNSANNEEHALNGGLRNSLKYSQVFFETRTPSDLGEIKTVVMFDFGDLANQGTYVGTTSSANVPSAGAGNNEVPRLQWAYGTLGPWLFGQTNTAWNDPLLTNPDIQDQAQVGPMQTANIRRPQVRYTYLAGNGVTLSASVESNTYSNTYVTAATGSVASVNEDSTDTGGVTNWPSFNAGIAWDQPWGHMMGRVGVVRDELRNATGTNIVAGTNSNNLASTGWAVEGGAMINTWGNDQWRGLVVYSSGAQTYLTDMPASAFVNGATGAMDVFKELAVNTSYIHRFSPHWRTTAEIGMGFFNKPSNTAGFTNTASGTTGAQLASFEKRHLESGLSLTYSPVPGMMDISAEWDHWERWVQASSTSGHSNAYNLWFIFYW